MEIPSGPGRGFVAVTGTDSPDHGARRSRYPTLTARAPDMMNDSVYRDGLLPAYSKHAMLHIANKMFG
jgi:hypothetical protein